MTELRRFDDAPLPNEALGLVARVAAERGIRITEAFADTALQDALLRLVREADNPIRFHGKRIEEMFVYVLAALGRIVAVKREETADIIVPMNVAFSVPDFRVVLRSGLEFLVEVKNCNASVGRQAFKRPYLEGLREYGRLFQRSVYIAIYWSKWRVWTLHPVEDLLARPGAEKVRVAFIDALPISHMSSMGDVMIATEYPLTVRISVDAEIISRSEGTSQQRVLIESVDILVQGRRIQNPRDKAIGFGLAQHGKWAETEHLHTEADLVRTIEFSFAPNNPDPEQPFAIVASLSELASGQFDDLTTYERVVTRFRPKHLPSPPYPNADEKYFGVDLRLWKFMMQADPGTTAPMPEAG